MKSIAAPVLLQMPLSILNTWWLLHDSLKKSLITFIQKIGLFIPDVCMINIDNWWSDLLEWWMFWEQRLFVQHEFLYNQACGIFPIEVKISQLVVNDKRKTEDKHWVNFSIPLCLVNNYMYNCMVFTTWWILSYPQYNQTIVKFIFAKPWNLLRNRPIYRENEEIFGLLFKDTKQYDK